MKYLVVSIIFRIFVPSNLKTVTTMPREKYELKIYWDDEVTVECRYFYTKKDATDYAVKKGIPKSKYTIVTN